MNKKVFRKLILSIVLLIAGIGIYRTINQCEAPGCSNYVNRNAGNYCDLHRCSWNKECQEKRTDGNLCEHHAKEQAEYLAELDAQRKEFEKEMREMEIEYMRKKNLEEEQKQEAQKKRNVSQSTNKTGGYYRHDYRDDVDDYDDPGDFADEFEDEFDSWEDAYEYWEDNE